MLLSGGAISSLHLATASHNCDATCTVGGITGAAGRRSGEAHKGVEVFLVLSEHAFVPTTSPNGVSIGSGTLRLIWLLLSGALGRNIPCKETRKPSDKL